MNPTRTAWTDVAIVSFALAMLATAGCARHARVVESRQLTIYYCKGGTEALVPVRYAIDPKLDEQQLASFAVSQLLAGPGALSNAVVLFPPGTKARVLRQTGTTATVDLTGAISQGLHAGATDEVALFKSLTFTLTNLPNIKDVQVLIDGRKVAALPGGHLDLSEPLNRDAFEQ